MEPRQVYPRRRHQRRKASDEVQRLQHDVRRKLERYKDWANYERLRTYYVEAAYRNLLTYR